ncbi:hypothetical protein REPUB_Repub12eG0030700 [Reevesia pubescens]
MRGGLAINRHTVLKLRQARIATLGSVKIRIVLCVCIALILLTVANWNRDSSSSLLGWTGGVASLDGSSSPWGRYAIVINTWNRYDLLNNSISHYASCPRLDFIPIVWSEPDPPSDAVFSIDEDVYISLLFGRICFHCLAKCPRYNGGICFSYALGGSNGVRSCYDEGKRVAEALMFDYHRQQIHIARIFNTYGQRMNIDDGQFHSSNTSAFSTMGTPDYIAPEVLLKKEFGMECYGLVILLFSSLSLMVATGIYYLFSILLLYVRAWAGVDPEYAKWGT